MRSNKVAFGDLRLRERETGAKGDATNEVLIAERVAIVPPGGQLQHPLLSVVILANVHVAQDVQDLRKAQA